MKFRFAIAALATTVVGLAFAQTPAPQPTPQQIGRAHV